VLTIDRAHSGWRVRSSAGSIELFGSMAAGSVQAGGSRCLATLLAWLAPFGNHGRAHRATTTEDRMGTTENCGAIARRTGLALGLAAVGGVLLSASGRAADAKGAIKVTALYGTPKDPAAFEAYYARTHMPMVYAVKEIKHIELAKPLPGPDGKAPAFYRITELWFENMQVMQGVTSRPEWKKIADDVANFATGGATILVSQVE
jgi:uncharacterized protein (TIGR02118 family)